MSFIYFQIIIAIFLPLNILSQSDYNDDILFEVSEPCISYNLIEIILKFAFLFLADISYTFRCRRAQNFGGNFKHFHKDIYLIPAKPIVGCSRLQNQPALKDNIALIERGDCSFVTKVINAQESNALGVIVMDNDRRADNLFVDMIDDSTKRNVHIPAMFIQYGDGHMILDSIEKKGLIGARIHIPLNLTYNEILKVNRSPGSHWL
ncbi:unnamed protein product [Adineta steineri]|uniref:PA domain-containing protein n=1 Tax=Adineta steineri TaxID=433720 RepID=A0A814BB37_9BILA|nr:unnamed protein product [Adineta steineri]CAF3669383.1 unnamed protein product [Adineta steineri]